MNDTALIYWWKRGWTDERYGSSSVESDDELDNKAYQLGAKQAVVDMTSDMRKALAEHSDEDILKSIRRPSDLKD